MERFIKVTKAKLIVMCLSTLLPILVISILPSLDDVFKPYYDILTLRYLLFVIVEAAIIYKIVRYIRILKNSEYANNAFIRLHDERLTFVKMKSCQLSIKIILYALSIVTVAFGFVDRSIFYTLLSVLAVIVLTQTLTAIYYNKKY